MFSVSTVLGEKASDVEQCWGASAKLPDRRLRPHWTGRGPVNEGIMFGELSFFSLFFFSSSSFFFFFFFFLLRSVHGCMGMDVWVNVFRMPFLRADSGPWRKMSRAWPPMSAITSSGSTCPSHQESAWGAAEARQERVIVQVVRKAIVVEKHWSMCWTHLQMFSVSTVLGEKASEVEHSWGASAKLPESRPPPHWTGRVPQKERHIFSELSILLFVCVMSVHGWMGKDVWVNVFRMPFLCADSGKWRKMSRAWPAMPAMATSSVTTWPNHQESAWWAAEAGRKALLWRWLERALLTGDVRIFVEHIYQCFLSVLS